ncbi:AMP-binding protein [Mitsuaria sp. WAJ17]|uniref:type I polyketide synthase n=1 Tax=Mitsuaria sp. WAJ17 TaxID=2761452 RepID=UPI00160068DA|nr:type I polyketide synthase [Mitsuaria sp. WAJ17]MBB2487697.1 AMP-binding protein [Mitsuaria sp. WAJ17]
MSESPSITCTSDPAPNSWVALLRAQAARRPEHAALVFLPDGEREGARLSYAQLDQRARGLAAALQAQGLQDRHVLLMLPSGVHYVLGFLACLYAGAVPVPGYPPSNGMHARRMAHIARDCEARAALVSATQDGSEALREACAGLAGPVLRIDDEARLQGDAAKACEPESWRPPRLDRDSVAYLQYTSGSTSQPRGVIVTHGNLLAHAAGWHCAPGLCEDDVFVSWLPLFHDMGLILGLLQMFHEGGTVVLMPPLAFVQQPLRWLQAISRYRGTASYAPNFAYELCCQAAQALPSLELDLTHWAVAGNGAEPVRAETLARFQAQFAPFGLRAEALSPGYGLAEATLTVTRQPRLTAPPVVRASSAALARGLLQPAEAGQPFTELVGCGQAWPGAEAVIADPLRGEACPDGRVGEIWVRGEVVAHGYWRQAALSEQAFLARMADGNGPWLRTGDLGAWHEGQLFITGRIKDVIVIRGQNHYPQDLERSAQSAHEALAGAQGAAFALELDGQEKLVLLQEVRRSARHRLDGEAITAALREAMAASHGLHLHAVCLLRPASLPMTSSGKIQRHACRQLFLDGGLKPLHQWQDTTPTVCLPAARANTELSAWLLARCAALSHLPQELLTAEQSFASMGLDSMDLVTLSGELSARLGRRVEPTLLYAQPRITALLAALGSETPATIAATTHLPPDEPIAVIGMACRLPGAEGAEAFWQLLDEGRDAVTEVPADRWDAQALAGNEPGRSASRWGGFIEGIEQFDAAFFGISAREADAMDPQQRLLLQACWHALEDAGLRAESLVGSDTGVFIGAMTHDYQLLQLRQGQALDAYFGTGNQASILANRLSYVLGLQGPSWTVETACSSSLVALHQARRALLDGDCSLALVGGVNALLAPDLYVALSQAQMLSPDGRCRAFDASANGYVRAEGCAVLVLKRLSEAQRDSDRILGLLRGSAVNQDGRSNGLTAPNGPAQQAVMRKALAGAGLQAQSVSYLEAHGTGTALGDPIEMESIQQVYGRSEGPPLWVGSVKSNIGHAEPLAGLAGLCKVLLALRHERIPASLHVQQLNPLLRLEGSGCSVAREAQPWPRGDAARLAAISSFGFGGTNAHVIVEEAPALPEPPASNAGERPALLVLSARSDCALRQLAEAYAHRIDALQAPLQALCQATALRRSALPHRLAVVAADSPALAAALRAHAQGETDPALFTAEQDCVGPRRTAFLFTGQGSQYPDMGRGLYRSEPVFRRSMDHCAALLRPWLGFSLTEALYVQADVAGTPLQLEDTAHAQPALFALEWSLAQLWAAAGVQPDVLLGHSLGEYVAACLAGVFSLADGLRLVAERGRLMRARCEAGAMLVLQGPAPALQTLCQESLAGGRLALAARNAADCLVLGGAPEAIEACQARALQLGLEARRLPGQRAFHSPAMQTIRSAFAEVLAGISLQAPRLPLISNLDGQLCGEALACADYWLDHACQTVEFEACLDTLAAQDCARLIEIGPDPVLSSLARRHPRLDSPGRLWLCSLRRGRDEHRHWLETLARWTVSGGETDWQSWYAGQGADAAQAWQQVRQLPAYPFQTEAHWFQPATSSPLPTSTLGQRKTSAAAPAMAETPHPPTLPENLLQLPPEAARQALLDYLRLQTFQILRLSTARRQDLTPSFPDSALSQLGFDSLMALELRKQLARDTGIELALRQLLVNTTARELAGVLHRLMLLQDMRPADETASADQGLEEILL